MTRYEDERSPLRRAARVSKLSRARWGDVAVTTACLMGAMLLGLGAAGSSQALLSDSATLPGASISAGTAEILIDEESSARLAGFAPTPRRPAVRAMMVSNVGQAALALSARAVVTSHQALVSSALLRITPVDARSDCAPGLTGEQHSLGGFVSEALGQIGAAEEQILCVEVALVAGAPAAHSGQGFGFGIEVSGVQVKG